MYVSSRQGQCLTYDAVSNVLSVVNGASVPQSGKAGGQMAHAYTYDALYRLVSATGTYTGADNKTASYTLAMGYDNMHRITSKRQILTQNNVQFNGTLNAGYDLSYTYGTETGKKFQLANVKDVNYRTEETPSESENVNNSHAYEYDANGNLIYVNTSRTKKDGIADEKAAERKLKWDEENRLLASDDNGFVTNYWYDADGERTVKTSGESDQVYVNSEFAGGRTNTAKFSLYVSPYLVANQGGRYTKHIYIGSQRVVSKIGDFDSYGSDPRRIQYAGSETDGLSVDYKGKYTQQLQVIKDNYTTFAVPYNGEDNNDYVDGKGFCCNDGSLEAAQSRVMARAMKDNFQESDTYEKMQFYYHPDHLGSSSYITNLDGEVVQHIEYVPFGEVFIEERNNIWNTPYLFNAKEFDEETGLYYYGARYYDPRLSLWISTDPLEEFYPNITSYTYCHNNPIILIDPSGMSDKEAQKRANTLIDQFEKSKTTSVFPHISKSEFINDLRSIVKKPSSIDQKEDGTCGAAVLCKYLADEQPELFVKTAISLYTKGKATNRSMTLSVTDDMKKEGANCLSAVNTIMQGALTNANNWFLSYNPNSDGSGIRSFTYPGFISRFLKQFVGATFRVKPSPTTRGLGNINYQDYFVIGLITQDFSSSPMPNHYIQITKVNNDKIHFWSWGSSYVYTTKNNYFNGIKQAFLIQR